MRNNIKKRVAIVAPGFLPIPALSGGAVEVLTTYILQHNENFNDVEFIIFTPYHPELNKCKFKNTKIEAIYGEKAIKYKYLCKVVNWINRITLKKVRFNPYEIELIWKIRNYEFDYIVIENNMFFYDKIYEFTKYKNNLIYHMHNDIDGISKTNNMAEKIINTAHKILVVSNYLKNRLLKIKECTKIEVLENCIDFNNFIVGNQVRNMWRNKYNIKNTDLVLLYSGRINDDKGVKELVLAFKDASKQIKNLKLVVVGNSWFGNNNNDNYFDELQEISLGVESIIFTGFIKPDNIPNILAAADIAIVPSKWEEPFGVVVLEAMAMKLPLIVTKSGGLIEIVDEKFSLIIERENLIENLTNAILNLANDEKKREIMGENAGKALYKNKKIYSHEYYYNNFITMAKIKK